jgi:hypothetical protein
MLYGEFVRGSLVTCASVLTDLPGAILAACLVKCCYKVKFRLPLSLGRSINVTRAGGTCFASVEKIAKCSAVRSVHRLIRRHRVSLVSIVDRDSRIMIRLSSSIRAAYTRARHLAVE